MAWNEEGHRFSWRMKLRSKSGKTHFIVENQEGIRWYVDPSPYLNKRQRRKMRCIPDMILQFAHHLEDIWEERGHPDTKVYAHAQCSLNTRDRTPLIDSTVDLTEIERSLKHADWILPLTEKLPKRFLFD